MSGRCYLSGTCDRKHKERIPSRNCGDERAVGLHSRWPETSESSRRFHTPGTCQPTPHEPSGLSRNFPFIHSNTLCLAKIPYTPKCPVHRNVSASKERT